MNTPCECCQNQAVSTPAPLANRPGLSALRYRVGTHGNFLEMMKARLSSSDYPALNHALTTREDNDASIALLDAWATVADVLTFYQERIANEGYLRTATERRSVLELARLTGYRLRPGVAASVPLAFTIENDFDAEIPAGTRTQSVPEPGELSQPFETSTLLKAKSAWNTMKPRLSLPQYILPTTTVIYLKGNISNLKPNTPLLIIDSLGGLNFRRVSQVEASFSAGWTKVILTNQGEIYSDFDVLDVLLKNMPEEEGPYSKIIGDKTLSDIKISIEKILRLLGNPRKSVYELKLAIRLELPRINQTYRINKALNFDILAGWVQRVLQSLNIILNQLDSRPELYKAESTRLEENTSLTEIAEKINEKLLSIPRLPSISFSEEIGTSELNHLKISLSELCDLITNDAIETSEKLCAISGETLRIEQLYEVFQLLKFLDESNSTWFVDLKNVFAAFMPDSESEYSVVTNSPLINIINTLSFSFANRQFAKTRFTSSVSEFYTAKTDMGSRLLKVFRPALSKTLYKARRSQTIKPSPARVYLLGIQASLFGYNVPPQPPYNPEVWKEWEPAPDEFADKIFLDGVIDSISPANYIAIRKPGTVQPELFQVKDVVIRPRREYGICGKTTEITLNIPNGSPGWRLATKDEYPLIRGTTVYIPSLPLELSESPIETDIPKTSELELDDLYEDLAPGRLLIISGEMIDELTHSNLGVQISELATLAYVTEDTRKVQMGGNNYDLPGDSSHTTLHLSDRLINSYKRNTVTIYANVVDATHGETVHEVFGSGNGSQTFQQFTLRQVPLTYTSAPNVNGIESSLILRVNGVKWHEAENLLKPGLRDRQYIIRIDDDGKTSLLFGDGLHGARLPTGFENITGQYRYGIGKVGNVKAEQIKLLATRPLHVKGVINPLASTGGADPESRDQARYVAPRTVTALDRLVSVRDYADLARTYAGIGKASAVRLSDGRREVIHVTIAGQDDIPINDDSPLFYNLRSSLHQYGDPYLPILVALRKLKLLVISARVRLDPDHAWELVEPKIRSAVQAAFSFERRELGQAVTASEVISTIQAVEGVEYVELDTLDAVDEQTLITFLEQNGEQSTQNGQSTLVEHLDLGLQDRIPAELAKTDQKKMGAIIPTELAYLDSDLPDTLILMELSK